MHLKTVSLTQPIGKLYLNPNLPFKFIIYNSSVIGKKCLNQTGQFWKSTRLCRSNPMGPEVSRSKRTCSKVLVLRVQSLMSQSSWT